MTDKHVSLTNEQLEAIRKRVEAATPGPWNWRKLDGEPFETEMPSLVSPEGDVMDFGYCATFYPVQGTPPEDADAEFIAHAREDVPALLAEIEHLKEIALDILEDYDEAKRHLISEVSTNGEAALKFHQANVEYFRLEINGGDDE